MPVKHFNRDTVLHRSSLQCPDTAASESHLLTSQITPLGKPRAVIPMTRKIENIHRGMKQYFNLPGKVIPKGWWIRGQKCQVLQKLNSSLINHSTQATAKLIVLVLTITRKKEHIPATVTTLFFPLISNSSMFGSIGRTKNRNIHLKGRNSDIFPKNNQKEQLMHREKQTKTTTPELCLSTERSLRYL